MFSRPSGISVPGGFAPRIGETSSPHSSSGRGSIRAILSSGTPRRARRRPRGSGRSCRRTRRSSGRAQRMRPPTPTTRPGVTGAMRHGCVRTGPRGRFRLRFQDSNLGRHRMCFSQIDTRYARSSGRRPRDGRLFRSASATACSAPTSGYQTPPPTACSRRRPGASTSGRIPPLSFAPVPRVALRIRDDRVGARSSRSPTTAPYFLAVVSGSSAPGFVSTADEVSTSCRSSRSPASR